jgi:hypothetical protein
VCEKSRPHRDSFYYLPIYFEGHVVAQLVEGLRYKLKGPAAQ